MDLKAFDDYVGQQRIIKQLLPDLAACLKQHKTAPHLVLYGRPGLGKDYLALRIAQYLGARVHMYFGSAISRDRRWSWDNVFKQMKGPDPNNPWPGLDMAGFIRQPELLERHTVILNEAESIPTVAWEDLHAALVPDEEGRRTYPHFLNRTTGSYRTRWAPPFQMICLTNFITRLRKNGMAAMDRCPMIAQLQPYTEVELANIVVYFSKKHNVDIDEPAAMKLSRCSKASPRRAEQLWQSCDNERALVDGKAILEQHVQSVMERCGIADDGLDEQDLDYLAALADSPSGVGQDRLACVLGMPVDVLDTEIEPWLFQQKLITVVTGAGRVLTQEGFERANRSGKSDLRFA